MPEAIITLEQVKHVARLAKLSLDEAEFKRMTQELGAILQYAALLNELDTSAIEPTSQVMVQQLPLREDRIQEGLSREVVLGQSPNSSNDGFAVPAFVEE